MTSLVSYAELSPEQLLAATGQAAQTTRFDDFPRVAINKLGTDDQERVLPVGSYAVSQEGKAVYGKPIKFRPFLNVYQYAVYDDVSNTYPNKSVLFKNFGEEAIDEKGGVACGRIPLKKRAGLSPEQLKQQEKVKCYRILYGLATFNGTTADSEQVEITNLPVKFRLSGDNFMPVQETLDLLSKKKLSMLNYNLNLGTIRKKQGTNVWYQMTVELDNNHVAITKEDWENLKAFQDSIDKENKFVIEKHRAASSDKLQLVDDQNTLHQLEAELNDDITFVGANVK